MSSAYLPLARNTSKQWRSCLLMWLQVNCEPEPLGPENPHAIGFCAKETELTHELAAIRNVNAESSRIWKIKNESVRNRLTGLQSAYTLDLSSNAFKA